MKCYQSFLQIKANDAQKLCTIHITKTFQAKLNFADIINHIRDIPDDNVPEKIEDI